MSRKKLLRKGKCDACLQALAVRVRQAGQSPSSPGMDLTRGSRGCEAGLPPNENQQKKPAAAGGLKGREKEGGGPPGAPSKSGIWMRDRDAVSAARLGARDMRLTLRSRSCVTLRLAAVRSNHRG